MSDNKCKSCGQWSGKGHKCPTPVVPISPDRLDRPDTPVNETRDEVDDRVARARAAISRDAHVRSGGPMSMNYLEAVNSTSDDRPMPVLSAEDEAARVAIIDRVRSGTAFAIEKNGFHVDPVTRDQVEAEFNRILKNNAEYAAERGEDFPEIASKKDDWTEILANRLWLDVRARNDYNRAAEETEQWEHSNVIATNPIVAKAVGLEPGSPNTFIDSDTYDDHSHIIMVQEPNGDVILHTLRTERWNDGNITEFSHEYTRYPDTRSANRAFHKELGLHERMRAQDYNRELREAEEAAAAAEGREPDHDSYSHKLRMEAF